MALSTALLYKYRRRFLWVFAASSLVLLVSFTSMFTMNAPIEPVRPAPPSGGGGGAGGGGGGSSQPDVAILISLASLATSGASLAGFFLTSALAWRKERRESKHSEVDLEKKKLEVEKLRMDLAAKQDENAKNTGSGTEA